MSGAEGAVTAVIDGAIGRITLNRPERMNAVTVALASELAAALHDLGRRRDLNVIVLRGSGGNFCAGGDFDEVERLRAQGPAALKVLFTEFRRACDTIAEIDVPVVAAVERVAAAGGFELMQAADIVLVSDTARIADNHIRFGMIPGGGSTARLPASSVASRRWPCCCPEIGCRAVTRLPAAWPTVPAQQRISSTRSTYFCVNWPAAAGRPWSASNGSSAPVCRVPWIRR